MSAIDNLISIVDSMDIYTGHARSELSKLRADLATAQARIAELEAHIELGRQAASAAIDYFESLEYTGHCYQLLLNWYSTQRRNDERIAKSDG